MFQHVQIVPPITKSVNNGDPMESTMDKALKSSQVREILGIGRTTLYRLDIAGILPARKMHGSRLYYLESDVQNYLKSMPYHRETT
jgi:predicted DNA-binding transcriptional regulator AlpA